MSIGLIYFNLRKLSDIGVKDYKKDIFTRRLEKGNHNYLWIIRKGNTRNGSQLDKTVAYALFITWVIEKKLTHLADNCVQMPRRTENKC